MAGAQNSQWWVLPNGQLYSSIPPFNGQGWETGNNAFGYPGFQAGGNLSFTGSGQGHAGVDGHFSESTVIDQVSRSDLAELRCLIYDKYDVLDRKKQDALVAASHDSTVSERIISLGKNLSTLDNTLGSLDERLSDAVTGTVDRIEDSRETINLIRQEVMQHVRVLEILAKVVLQNHKDQMEADESELIEGFVAGEEVTETRV